MQREAVYEAWVPEKGAWSLWARPVLFGHMSRTSGTDSVDTTPIQWAWALFGSAADTPAKAGEFKYRCRVHGKSMNGTIVVKAAEK